MMIFTMSFHCFSFKSARNLNGFGGVVGALKEKLLSM